MRITSARRPHRPLAFRPLLFAAACLVGASTAGLAQTVGNDARSTSGGSSSTLGLVYSSANANAQSLIRIFNGTSSNDWMHSGASVTLTLHDGSTGTTVGTWVSPLLKAGVSMQFPIAEIESGLSPGVTKPATYAITAQAAKTGMAIQNEVLRSNDGLLSNMTACDTGVASLGRVLINVHSSQFSGNYPSTVAITNSGAKTLGFSVEIYDAEGGYFMGSFPTPIIPSGGHVIMSVAAMEAAAHITPSRFTPTYVIRFGRSSDGDYNFTAFFQHLVNNTRSGVITDMTTLCPVGGPEPSYHSVDGSLHTGLIFSSANGSGQSYLQIANTDSVAGTVTLTLQDSAAGTSLGRWTSPSIPAGAAQEFPIGDIEGAVPLPPAKPAYYGLTVQSTFAGELQHVLRANSDSTPTDLSICDFGTGPSSSRLNGVHSSRLDATFPSTVVVTNTATTPGPVTLALYDATTGTRLGAATTPPIPAGGHLSLSSSELETAAQVTPSASQLRYVIRTEGTFSGFLQHLVTNTNTGAVTDLTIACKLQLDSTKDNQPPLGATLADVPPGVDLAHLPPGIDLSRLSPSLRDLILSLQ